MRKTFFGSVIAGLAILLLALAGCIGGGGIKESRIKVVGSSMAPALKEGQEVKSVPVELKDLKRGDIVLVEPKQGESLLKRLIGLPGETVEIREGYILINNQILHESYDASVPDYVLSPLTLAHDEYFVLGDNRSASSDSHNFGPVKASMIKGRVTP